VRDRLKQEYVVAVVYVSAMFVNVLDTTIMNVALPTLSREFEVGTSSIEWVITGYLLSLAVWIPASGWIGDRVGTKRTFLFAVAMFTAASALCGQAQSLEQLVAFRILQGVGGGMLTPVGFAMLMRAFPPERRAQASKILIIPTAIGPASGPILGGLVVDSLSWRWAFYINLPIGIAAFTFGLLFLKERREPQPGRFDLPGFLLSGSGLALILYALSRGPVEGWGAPATLVPAALGIAAFTALVFVELRRDAPLLQLRLLKGRMFRSALVTSGFSMGGFLGVLFVMPLFLQQARGASPLESGLTTFPEAIGVICMSQIVGRLYHVIGPRRLVSGGLAAMSVCFVALTTIDEETSFWTIRVMMFVTGFTLAFTIIPIQASAFAGVEPAQTGRASAIFNASRQMSAALGVAILATILSVSLPEGVPAVGQQVSAFHHTFLAAAGIAALGSVLAFAGIRDTDAAATMKAKARPPAAEPVTEAVSID
jgi:EmrB/QacA subfamily drug resistance transporter